MIDFSRLASDIRSTVYAQYKLALACTKVPRYIDAWSDMQKIKPGDLVVEISSIYDRNRDFIAVGYFVKKEKVKEDDGEFDLTTIKLLDGTEQFWNNCEFITPYVYR